MSQQKEVFVWPRRRRGQAPEGVGEGVQRVLEGGGADCAEGVSWLVFSGVVSDCCEMCEKGECLTCRSAPSLPIHYTPVSNFLFPKMHYPTFLGNGWIGPQSRILSHFTSAGIAWATAS